MQRKRAAFGRCACGAIAIQTSNGIRIVKSWNRRAESRETVAFGTTRLAVAAVGSPFDSLQTSLPGKSCLLGAVNAFFRICSYECLRY